MSGLSHVNVIGGLNGIGKSTLLEAIFLYFDRSNPIGLLRSYQLRKVPLGPSDNVNAIKQIFYRADVSKEIEILAKCQGEEKVVKYKFGKQAVSKPMAQQVNQDQINQLVAETMFSTTGEGYSIDVSSKINGKEFEAQVQSAGPGLVVNIKLNRPVEVVKATLLTSYNRGNDPGIPERYSKIKRQGKEGAALRFLQVVHPNVEELSLLSSGGTTILHANIGNGQFIPFQFLGEGAVGLISAILSIVDCSGGNVLLDELDSAVHYSALEKMWLLLIEVAIEFKTQIFITTHSGESINALVEALKKNGKHDVVAYHRLRPEKSGDVSAVTYKGQQLSDAIAQRWEVR